MDRFETLVGSPLAGLPMLRDSTSRRASGGHSAGSMAASKRSTSSVLVARLISAARRSIKRSSCSAWLSTKASAKACRLRVSAADGGAGNSSAARAWVSGLNERGVSIGRRSAGEAVWEEIIELSDGSALVLATGNLQTPRGMRFQGRGLMPTHALRDGVVDRMDYLMKVRELLAAARKTGRLRGEPGAVG